MPRDGSVSATEWEHPDYGIVRVFWRWTTLNGWSYFNEPVAVEFDLFTPDSEKRQMLADLAETADRVRIDRSISVSTPTPTPDLRDSAGLKAAEGSSSIEGIDHGQTT